MKKDKTDKRKQMTDNNESSVAGHESGVKESKDSTSHISHLTSHGYEYPDDEIDLIELFANIYKNKKIIITTTVIFMILGLLYSFLLVPNYKATFYAKNGIKDFSGYTPVSSLNVAEMSDWLESKLYFSNTREKNYNFEVEKKKESNLLRFMTYGNDTEEIYEYSQYFFEKIREDNFFKEPIEDSITKFENLIEDKNNQIKLTNVELENIGNRIKEIEYKIQKNIDEISITGEKITERERTLSEYRKLYSVNIKKNDEFQKKIKDSVIDSDSTTYLLYSNLLQYNLNQNTELIKTINSYETSIKDMNLRINTLLNQNKDYEIRKEELISKTKKTLEINIQKLTLDKKILSDHLERLSILAVLPETDFELNLKKKAIYVILSIFVGFFIGLIAVFFKNFNSAVRKQMTDDR